MHCRPFSAADWTCCILKITESRSRVPGRENSIPQLDRNDRNCRGTISPLRSWWPLVAFTHGCGPDAVRYSSGIGLCHSPGALHICALLASSEVFRLRAVSAADFARDCLGERHADSVLRSQDHHRARFDCLARNQPEIVLSE